MTPSLDSNLILSPINPSFNPLFNGVFNTLFSCLQCGSNIPRPAQSHPTYRAYRVALRVIGCRVIYQL